MPTREVVVLARLLEATCGHDHADGVFSDLLSAPTNAVRTLERHGLLSVEHGTGRALHARWLDTGFRHTDGTGSAPPDQRVIDDIYFMFDQYVNHPGAEVVDLPDAAAWTDALIFLGAVGVVEMRDTGGDRPLPSKTCAKFRNHLDFWRRRYPDGDWAANSSV